MAFCGATTREGTPCRRLVKADGRCYMHAVRSIYVAALCEEERELWHDVPLGTLDDEIRLAKIQIRRAVAADKPELIDRLTRTVHQLEKSRRDMDAGGGGDTPTEIARQIREALEAIEEVTDDPSSRS